MSRFVRLKLFPFVTGYHPMGFTQSRPGAEGRTVREKKRARLHYSPPFQHRNGPTLKRIAIRFANIAAVQPSNFYPTEAFSAGAASSLPSLARIPSDPCRIIPFLRRISSFAPYNSPLFLSTFFLDSLLGCPTRIRSVPSPRHFGL